MSKLKRYIIGGIVIWQMSSLFAACFTVGMYNRGNYFEEYLLASFGLLIIFGAILLMASIVWWMIGGYDD